MLTDEEMERFRLIVEKNLAREFREEANAYYDQFQEAARMIAANQHGED